MRAYSHRKKIARAVCALLAVIMMTGGAVLAFAESQEEVKVTPIGDAAAGVEYMKKSCTMCHSVPDPSTIKPYDEASAREFLATHMVTSTDEQLDDMIAYFFHIAEAAEEATEEITVTPVGDAAAGVEYMKKSCTMCHSVPDPSTIKPYDEVSGREFLATHMINSTDEQLDDMIAYFFHK